ncbi:proteasome subunit beta type-4 [Pipra filicauda]|uniref:Proteasome subunit beta type-4 n=1 Tax=Pipra filicauda TaxID=649802 RepID=A0A7R5K0M8_9PASS|nr:proteasome subunit beta type-4 [Pipra filicauda]
MTPSPRVRTRSRGVSRAMAPCHGPPRAPCPPQCPAQGSQSFLEHQFPVSGGIFPRLRIDEELLGDGHTYSPRAIHSWLTRVMYNRRSKINPLWNTVVIGGCSGGQGFLGYVDMLGVAYEAPTLATGFGAYLAQPLMREVLEKKQSLTQEEARDLLERCLRILYYRDARSFNRYELATVTEKGVQVEGPLTLEANWDIAHVVSGFE